MTAIREAIRLPKENLKRAEKSNRTLLNDRGEKQVNVLR